MNHLEASHTLFSVSFSVLELGVASSPGPRTRTQERQRHSTSRQRRADRLRLRCASYLYSGHVHIRRRASATAPAASALPTAYASRASRASCASRAAQPLRGGSGERGDQALSSVRPSGYGLDGPPSVARRVLRSIGAIHFFIPFKGFFCVWRPVQKSLMLDHWTITVIAVLFYYCTIISDG